MCLFRIEMVLYQQHLILLQIAQIVQQDQMLQQLLIGVHQPIQRAHLIQQFLQVLRLLQLLQQLKVIHLLRIIHRHLVHHHHQIAQAQHQLREENKPQTLAKLPQWPILQVPLIIQDQLILLKIIQVLLRLVMPVINQALLTKLALLVKFLMSKHQEHQPHQIPQG